MAKKPLLSGDSLDLLLDTMCNTFGGVMFIAIALVVISFFIPKIVVDVDPAEQDQEKIAELQAQIALCQEELRKQQIDRSLKEQLVERFRNHPHLDKIQELGKLKDDNAALQLLFGEAESAKNAWLVALKQAEREKVALDLVLTQQDLKIAELADLRDAQTRTIEDLNNIIAGFQVEPAADVRNIGVSPRTETDRQPFVCLMSANRLYMVHTFSEISLFDGTTISNSDDVTAQTGMLDRGDGQMVKVINIRPALGKGVDIMPSQDNTTSLDNIFRKIDKTKRFVWIMVNKDSFPGFIQLREYLKKNEFKSYWYPVVDEFVLTISDGGAYEDGE
ncbi:MAG: hypothetical protein JW808_02320 [Victivallales bacterium]|nr:hypothetical protein [Victivallales bacterium]